MGTFKERFISARGIAVYFLIFVLIVQLLVGASASVFADSTGLVIHPDGLNIRSGAGTYNPIVGTLPYHGLVTIVGEDTASDGSLWYIIESYYGYGYVCAEYITVNQTYEISPTEGSYLSAAEFEEYLDEQGFPDSYKPYLRRLHEIYPAWRFIAMHTGLDWEDVIYRETHPVSTSLVPNIWSDAWKSVEPAAYDPYYDEYIIFDSGGYVAASQGGVEYYMDPRNNLDADSVFQFLSNRFDASTQTIEGIKAIVAGSYLETRDPGDGYDNYAQIIYDAGKATGVNPMTIASMLLMEQGIDGSSDLISGVCGGYEGYYNFFNIGAYYADGRSAAENGLIYAMHRGWDSPLKSIIGGAEIYASNYVYNNKSTIYFQKYNVLNGLESVGTGQYMTAIYAAASEGKIMAAGYASFTDVGISFEIPVYRNMPSEACPIPSYVEKPKPQPKPEPITQDDPTPIEKEYSVDASALKNGSGIAKVTLINDAIISALDGRITYIFKLSDGSTMGVVVNSPVEAAGAGAIIKVGGIMTPYGAKLIETQVALTDTKDSRLSGKYHYLAGDKK